MTWLVNLSLYYGNSSRTVPFKGLRHTASVFISMPLNTKRTTCSSRHFIIINQHFRLVRSVLKYLLSSYIISCDIECKKKTTCSKIFQYLIINKITVQTNKYVVNDIINYPFKQNSILYFTKNITALSATLVTLVHKVCQQFVIW